MKCHEKPILTLIWLKQVGHQDGDAWSSWQRWLRTVLPARTAVRERGQPWVPRARGAGGRWGGPQTMALQSIVWAMCRVLAGSRKRVHPRGGGGRAGLLGGVSWGWVCE